MFDHLKTIITQPTMSKPDWDYWGKKRSVALWHALSLSFDISPNTRLIKGFYAEVEGTDSNASYWHVEGFRDLQHQARYEIVLSHLDMSESFVVLHRPQRVSPAEFIIDLPSFGLWTEKQGISVPAEFPTRFDASQKSLCDNDAVTEVGDPIISDRLQQLIEIAKECYSQKGPLDKQTNIASLIGEKLGFSPGPDGTASSTARAIASVIRPNAQRKKDKRSHTSKKSVN